MVLGSIIGFALVFVLVTWTASAVMGVALISSAKTLSRLGSAAEKRAAALALVIPPLLGGIVALALAGYSAFPGFLGGADHCDSHGDHLHLCLVHGGDWATRAWALSLISALSAIVLVRVAQLVDTIIRGRRRVAMVERSSQRIAGDAVPVFLSPSKRPFCFVSGFRSPRIFVASSLWDRSSEDEREAMLGHEHSHVENGDLWRSVALSIFALFGAPLLGAQFKRLWGEATERLCDRLAADRTGDPASIAAALVNVARGPRFIGVLSFMPRPESVKHRVIAVLSQERTGRPFARHLLQGAGVIVVTTAIATATLADPLHHALETLLGLI
jgi:Zn-dependent protease with chaperone function